jgi:hypothetical protein
MADTMKSVADCGGYQIGFMPVEKIEASNVVHHYCSRANPSFDTMGGQLCLVVD